MGYYDYEKRRLDHTVCDWRCAICRKRAVWNRLHLNYCDECTKYVDQAATMCGTRTYKEIQRIPRQARMLRKQALDIPNPAEASLYAIWRNGRLVYTESSNSTRAKIFATKQQAKASIGRMVSDSYGKLTRDMFTIKRYDLVEGDVE